MAFECFIPQVLNLTSDDEIIEGASYRREVTLQKLVNNVLTPVNMTEYDALAPVLIVKDKDTEGGGATTSCPQGTCTWTDAAGGKFQIDIPASQTNLGTGAASGQKISGIVEVWVKHDSEVESGSPKEAMVCAGTWSLRKTGRAA